MGSSCPQGAESCGTTKRPTVTGLYNATLHGAGLSPPRRGATVVFHKPPHLSAGLHSQARAVPQLIEKISPTNGKDAELRRRHPAPGQKRLDFFQNFLSFAHTATYS